MTELDTPWNDKEAPDDYKPDFCPPEKAQMWTNAENPGSNDCAKWEWDLLVDLAYIASSNPTTIQENVEVLLEALTAEEKQKIREDMKESDTL